MRSPEECPKAATTCKLDANNNLYLYRSHKHFHQIQGQLALTDMQKSVLITKKLTVDSEFDEEVWLCSRIKR